MKIQIQQTKLIEILDYLYVDGLFPLSIVTTKDGKLFSAQNDKEGFAMRYAVFLGDYFKQISKEEESVQWDIEKMKKFVNLRKPETFLTIEYPVENKLVIKGENVKTRIVVSKINLEDVKKKLPFIMKGEHKNIPHINKGQVALDTHVSLSLAALKKISSYGTAHGTEFFKFEIGKERQLQVFVGDVHAIEDDSILDVNAQVLNVNEELKVTFTKGIAEMAKTFSGDIEIHMRSHMPAWFSEVTHNHKFGVLLSPVRE